jgi:hypothetical protein
MVVMVLFLVMAAAVGSAFTTGGEVFSDGVLRSDLGATTRRVLNRILAEVGETRSDSPDFAVGTDFITYNRVEGISATGVTYGPARIIFFDGTEGRITLAIPQDVVEEHLTSEASGLAFTLDGSRLTVTLSVTRNDPNGGEPFTSTVTGDVDIQD